MSKAECGVGVREGFQAFMLSAFLTSLWFPIINYSNTSRILQNLAFGTPISCPHGSGNVDPKVIAVPGSALGKDGPDPTESARLDFAVQLKIQYPDARVFIIQGRIENSGDINVAVDYLRDRRVDPADITWETDSRNTAGGMEILSQRMSRGTPVVIATDASHAVRAKALACAYGVNVMASVEPVGAMERDLLETIETLMLIYDPY